MSAADQQSSLRRTTRSVLERLTTRDRMVAALVGLALLSAAVTSGLTGAVVAAAATAIVCVSAYAAARSGDRSWVVTLAVTLFALRVIFAVGMHLALVARGTGGALFFDDAGYVKLAGALAQIWHERSVDPGLRDSLHDPSLGNLYVKMAAALFWALGENALALKFVNTLFAVLAGIAVYRTMLNAKLPAPRLGLTLMLIWPSLVLWSALALKDAYAITATALTMWSTSEMYRGGRIIPWLAVSMASLLALQDVRGYMFLVLCILLPIATLLGVRGIRRWPAAVLATAMSASLILVTPAAELLSPNVFSWTAFVRHQMAAGARSAFVPPAPIARGDPGQAWTVVVPGQTPPADSTPRTIEIPAGAILVTDPTASAQPPDPQSGRESIPPVVFVRPGDVVVMRPGIGTPAPPRSSEAPLLITVLPNQPNVVSTPGPAPVGRGSEGFTVIQGVEANLRHLPLGIAFLLFAPFPLMARSAAELAAAPEMIVWYLAWPLALVAIGSAVRERRGASAFPILGLVSVGLILSLVEGNVGTLVRHRTMLLPFAAPLIAYGAATIRNRPRVIHQLFR